jgi:hypothetical protein
MEFCMVMKSQKKKRITSMYWYCYVLIYKRSLHYLVGLAPCRSNLLFSYGPKSICT